MKTLAELLVTCATESFLFRGRNVERYISWTARSAYSVADLH